jgi:hypothetical protein
VGERVHRKAARLVEAADQRITARVSAAGLDVVEVLRHLVEAATPSPSLPRFFD